MAGDGERFLGLTVLSDYLLSEGLESVLERLVDCRVTAVACSPTVSAPADEDTGWWQPPSDGGASPRRLDRPLWGQHALWVRSAPSFHPNPALYRLTPYRPRSANELTDAHGAIVAEFIAAAQARGMKVYFQVGAAQPPGILPTDLPLLPDGSAPEGRVAAIASLASEAVRNYNRAYAKDLLEHYPTIDGLRIDWPEYPCYTLDELFADFSVAAQQWCERHGWDFVRTRQSAARFRELLYGGLHNDTLARIVNDSARGYRALYRLARRAGTLSWLFFKAALSARVIANWRAALDEAGGREKELLANAFAPPFSFLTGFHYPKAAERCVALAPKLYTMHWPMIVTNWGQALLAANPGLDEELLVRALLCLFDLDDTGLRYGLADWHYPLPEEAHPVADEPQIRKLNQVVAAVDGAARVEALVHGYGPPEDFARRLALVRRSRAEGVWINRYGYLSDAKLEIVAAYARG